MFTGLVSEIGQVDKHERGRSVDRLRIMAPRSVRRAEKGDSLAVNGVCLTLVKKEKNSFWAEMVPETLSRTNLGALRPGDRVNLETSLSLGDPLGGHLVSGHVESLGKFSRWTQQDQARRLRVEAGPEFMATLIPQGSVCLDGVSLTVAAVDKNGFWVALIPHTLKATTLSRRKAGYLANLEADIIGKYVLNAISRIRGKGAKGWK